MANDRKRFELAVKKGLQLNQQKKWKEALGAFRIALVEYNNQPIVYAGIGDACVGLKHLSRALECYKLAARLDHSKGKYLLKVADIQERLGLLSEAGQTYTAAGEFNLRVHDVEAAVGNWERAVRLDPNLIGAHKRLAMVFQKQGDRKSAVREYLAIARILDMTGDKQKALQICRAALRLDPENGDILTAIELINKGEEAYPEPEDEPPLIFEKDETASVEEDSIFGAVRQMANLLERERAHWQLGESDGSEESTLLDLARRQAEEDLATELFREEDDEDVAAGEMIKLERDALISQALDFQARGAVGQAIAAYEKALSMGLKLPAAHFMVGLLYADDGRSKKAIAALGKAASDARFSAAARQRLAEIT